MFILYVCVGVSVHCMLNYYNVSPLPPPPLPPSLPPSLPPPSLSPSLPPSLPPSLAEFESAGVDVSRSMVASCGSGVTAAHIALAAHTLGSQIPVYDVRATTFSICINTLFRCALTCHEVGKGLCNHRLSKSKHGGQHLIRTEDLGLHI